MITRTSDRIVVNTAGLVPVCAWCVSRERRMALQFVVRCTDGICPDCQATLAPRNPFQLVVTSASGAEQTLRFSSAFSRGLAVIALAAQPVTLRILGVLIAVLAIATTAAAEPTFSGAGLTPYVIAVAGQGADLATTAHNYRLGLRESNPIYGQRPTLGRITLVKAGETAAILGLMHLFEKTGHPGAAKVVGYMGGIGGVIPAVINMRGAQ